MRKFLRRNGGSLSYLLKTEVLAMLCSIPTCPEAAGVGRKAASRGQPKDSGPPLPSPPGPTPPVLGNI